MHERGPWVETPRLRCVPEEAPVAPAGTEIMHGNVNTEPKIVFPAWAIAPQTPPLVPAQVTSAPQDICAHHKKVHAFYDLFSALAGPGFAEMLFCTCTRSGMVTNVVAGAF
jgi:hypothetical protein